MKIAYDAKRFFRNTSGLGNYSRDLIRILADYYPENEYHLLFKDKNGRGGDILEKPNVFFDKISKGFLARQTQMGFDAQQIDADIFHGLSGELPFGKTKKYEKSLQYTTLFSFVIQNFTLFLIGLFISTNSKKLWIWPTLLLLFQSKPNEIL